MNKILLKYEEFWSHLPNAKWINWAFTSLIETPDTWEVCQSDRFINQDWLDAYDAGYDLAIKQNQASIFSKAQDAIYLVGGPELFRSRAALRGSVLALMLWENSKNLMVSKTQYLQTMADLGDISARLIMPAAAVFEITHNGHQLLE